MLLYHYCRVGGPPKVQGYIGYILGLYRNNGKENGNYYLVEGIGLKV